MVPDVTKRTRQLTGSFAAIWALLAIVLSVSALIAPRTGPQLPVRTSFIAGAAVVHGMSASALEAGIEVGDYLVSVDGVPAVQVLWEMELEDGLADTYLFRKPDGSELSVLLEPVRAEDVDKLSDVLIHLALLLVSSLYLVIALFVWWTR